MLRIHAARCAGTNWNSMAVQTGTAIVVPNLLDEKKERSATRPFNGDENERGPRQLYVSEDTGPILCNRKTDLLLHR